MDQTLLLSLELWLNGMKVMLPWLQVPVSQLDIQEG
jgi:hypothetical protein